ncbi:hypothetical protein BGW80DRAFT_1249652 [Lactifluus volemus]|nr:hypothetical protein BGW80DRAFT_1249652 [Lactifluus volemus]
MFILDSLRSARRRPGESVTDENALTWRPRRGRSPNCNSGRSNPRRGPRWWAQAINTAAKTYEREMIQSCRNYKAPRSDEEASRKGELTMCDHTLENSAQHRQAGNEEGTQQPQNSSINGGFGGFSQDKELSNRRLAACVAHAVDQEIGGVDTDTLTFDVSASTTTSEPSPTDLLIAAKTRDLLNSLERGDANPSRPWAHYLDLLNYMGFERLPLEVHQLMLRKYYPHAPHAYENRFQIVMKNIRSAGWQAELDDYHFILEQFAAVGHYVGSKRFMLQALAHRLSLPCSEERRPTLIEETTKTARDLLRDMRARKIPLTSVNMDLAIRILRETVDEKGFDDLIKYSYGIDLAYPDRLPLEVIEQQVASKAKVPEARDPPLYSLQPLSTSGLNVIVDMLGRVRGTFPTSPTISRSPSFLFDEDEDDYSINPPSSPALPFASPNTVTFQYLIEHASRADHVVFARHYLVHAMHLDRDEDRRLKRDLCVSPIDQIVAPLLAVNRSMFLSVFGLSNRKKHGGLMWWTLRMIKRTLRRKHKDLFWYRYKRSIRYGQGIALGGDVSGAGSDSERIAEPTKMLPITTHAAQESSSSGVDLFHVIIQSYAPTASIAQPSRLKSKTDIFDLDLDSDRSHSTRPPRIFDIDTHISFLQRDVKQLEQLRLDVEAVFGRTTHRIKERLGRRVWSGKDVWLADGRTRVPVTKQFWKKT